MANKYMHIDNYHPDDKGIAPRIDPRSSDHISSPKTEQSYYSGKPPSESGESYDSTKIKIPKGDYSDRMIPNTSKDSYEGRKKSSFNI